MKLADLVALRNKLQPAGGANTDPAQFDYKFWKDTESLAKKQKEKALEVVQSLSSKPNEPGVILAGKIFRTELKETAPIKAFDLEVMIELLLEKFPKDRVFIRDCALKAKVAGKGRRTYTTLEIGVDTDD